MRSTARCSDGTAWAAINNVDKPPGHGHEDEAIKAARAELIELNEYLHRQQRRPLPSGLRTIVYLVRCEALGAVKIGRALNPASRLHEMQVGCPAPLTLIAWWEDSRWAEAQLHRRFAAFRARGEWFAEEGEFAEWVAWRVEMAAATGIIKDAA